jgi:hypothetical protein
MDILNLNDKNKDYLVGQILELKEKLSKKKAIVKKIQGDLEAARRNNQNLKQKINYLRLRIVERHKAEV